MLSQAYLKFFLDIVGEIVPRIPLGSATRRRNTGDVFRMVMTMPLYDIADTVSRHRQVFISGGDVSNHEVQKARRDCGVLHRDD